MKYRIAVLIVAAAVTLASGCSSLNRMAVGAAANALTGGGETFAGDPDPDLVREAIPFGLKTYESLLATVPDHQGLLLATASGFSSYAYLLNAEADLDAQRFSERETRLRQRARALYLRGRDYALRALEVRHAGFSDALRLDPHGALSQTDARDVEFLYWAAAGWAGATATGRLDAGLVAELPIPGMMMERVLELAPDYDRGAGHEFMIAYEGARPGGSVELARAHFKQALAYSQGERASVYVAMAESICVAQQNYEEFNALLRQAIGVDVTRAPQARVVNEVAQRRARWLLARAPDLFVDMGEG